MLALEYQEKERKKISVITLNPSRFPFIPLHILLKPSIIFSNYHLLLLFVTFNQI